MQPNQKSQSTAVLLTLTIIAIIVNVGSIVWTNIEQNNCLAIRSCGGGEGIFQLGLIASTIPLLIISFIGSIILYFRNRKNLLPITVSLKTLLGIDLILLLIASYLFRNYIFDFIEIIFGF